MRKKMQQNPAINLQKWITKTAKNYQKDKIRQNKTSSAAKKALLAFFKNPKFKSQKSF